LGFAPNPNAGRKLAARGLEEAMVQVFFKAGAACSRYLLTIMLFCLTFLAIGPSRADPLDEAAERYRPYMAEQIDQSLAGARTLRERLATKDMDCAKREWIAARVGWERAEVFTSGFVPDLDTEIDAWPNAVMGFHAIEAELFGQEHGKVDEQTDALIFHLADLDVKVHLIHLTPQGLLNGTARLAYEIGESKADGGESRLSGTSLNDMRNNADGIALAYDVIFAPSLTASDPKLAQAAKAKIAELQALVAVDDLRKLDSDKLRATSEELIVALQNSAPKIGLRAPTLEEVAQ
jgi:iron uptake system component EfeO